MPFSRLLILVAGLVTLPASEVALGHGDFLPSPQHPVGWRGDGSGVFPGASFALSTWSETEHVIWKTAMASHTNSAPIVVGDRVFTMREPDVLVCVDAQSGEVLWERENDPLEIRGESPATVARVRRLAELAKAARFLLLGERPDSRGKEEVLLERKEGFIRADDKLIAILEEAAALEPQVQDLYDRAARSVAQRADDLKGFVRDVKPLYDALGNYLADTYDFHGANVWPGYIDYTFPTPASDGRHVYAAMGQGQVVCYDLAGERIWARSLGLSPEIDGRGKQKSDRATYTQSPLLADGILVVQAGFLIRAFDAADGRTRWELPYTEQGAGYSCGTGAIVRLGEEPHLVTVHGWVIRVRDGKQVGDLEHGNSGSEDGGQSMVIDEQGDAYYFDGKRICRLGLSVADNGAVTGQEVYRREIARYKGATPIAYGGCVYLAERDGISVHDADSGEFLTKVSARVQKPSPIIVGDRLIAPSDKGDFTVMSLGREAERLGTASLVWSKPRNPWFERQWPETYAAIEREGRKFDNTISRQFAYGHPFAHGDRLYIRSVSHLYCIGTD